jgi:hypothetical protein
MTNSLSTNIQRESEFQFYPTPRELIWQLIGPYRLDHNSRVLEPSAGRGDIVDVIKANHVQVDISCCEIGADMRAVLLSKGYKVIGTDFMTLKAPYTFTHVIMNPPFLYGVAHVMKAWNMLSAGGELAVILPLTAINGDRAAQSAALHQVIDLFGAVEPIKGKQFSQAERKTDEQCCIVRLKKPANEEFDPFRDFSPNMDAVEADAQERALPITRDRVKALVLTYERAMKALGELNEKELIYANCVPPDLGHCRQKKCPISGKIG